MSKNPENGSKNLDGSKNLKYCSYCYKDGAFTFKGTAKEMQVFCKDKMVEMGSLKLKSWLFTRNIPRLERLKKRK